MSQNEPEILTSSLADLFEPILLEVINDSEVDLNNYSYLYLLKLLTSYCFKIEETHENEMLSERLFNALKLKEKGPKARSLKNLAESSLISVGFFSPFLKRKLVGVRYHIDIGITAYSHLYQTTKKPVFEDVSERFPFYVEILSSVKEKLNLSNDRNLDLLHLFELFNETGSEKAKKLLIENGVSISSSKKNSKQ